VSRHARARVNLLLAVFSCVIGPLTVKNFSLEEFFTAISTASSPIDRCARAK
jgi:hypothetical protein